MKPKRRVIKASAQLHFLRFPALFEEPVAAECLNCASDLTLHQPDMNSPERLLGVCESCKHWYLIDLLPDLTDGVFMRLPDHEVIRDLARANPSDGISLMGHEPDPNPPPSRGPLDEPGRTP